MGADVIADASVDAADLAGRSYQRHPASYLDGYGLLSQCLVDAAEGNSPQQSSTVIVGGLAVCGDQCRAGQTHKHTLPGFFGTFGARIKRYTTYFALGSHDPASLVAAMLIID